MNSVTVKIEAVPMQTNMWELFRLFCTCVCAVPMAKPGLLRQAVFFKRDGYLFEILLEERCATPVTE